MYIFKFIINNANNNSILFENLITYLYIFIINNLFNIKEFKFLNYL